MSHWPFKDKFSTQKVLPHLPHIYAEFPSSNDVVDMDADQIAQEIPFTAKQASVLTQKMMGETHSWAQAHQTSSEESGNAIVVLRADYNSWITRFQVCRSEKPICSACRYLTRLRIKWSYVKDIIGVSRRQSCQIEDTSCNHTWIRLSVVPFPFAPNRSRITGCVGGRKGANSRIAISKILAPTDGWFFLVFHRTRYPNSMDVILYARRIDSKSDRSSSS